MAGTVAKAQQSERDIISNGAFFQRIKGGDNELFCLFDIRPHGNSGIDNEGNARLEVLCRTGDGIQERRPRPWIDTAHLEQTEVIGVVFGREVENRHQIEVIARHGPVVRLHGQ